MKNIVEIPTQIGADVGRMTVSGISTKVKQNPRNTVVTEEIPTPAKRVFNFSVFTFILYLRFDFSSNMESRGGI